MEMSQLRSRQEKWDTRFLELAAFVARWSKDPSTKVGAVIADNDFRVVSLGFNGLPRWIEDSPDRYDDKNKKYSMVIHGELNAILFAPRSVSGCTLYTWPFAPCSVCASLIVQVGIKRIVAPLCTKELGHWIHESIERATVTFVEAGIELALPKMNLTMQVNSELSNV
jgi:dCMP deaminase